MVDNDVVVGSVGSAADRTWKEDKGNTFSVLDHSAKSTFDDHASRDQTTVQVLIVAAGAYGQKHTAFSTVPPALGTAPLT